MKTDLRVLSYLGIHPHLQGLSAAGLSKREKTR